MSDLMNDIVKFMQLMERHSDMSGIEKKARVIDSVKFRNKKVDKSLISAIIDSIISIQKGDIKIKEIKTQQVTLLNCCCDI